MATVVKRASRNNLTFSTYTQKVEFVQSSIMQIQLIDSGEHRVINAVVRNVISESDGEIYIEVTHMLSEGHSVVVNQLDTPEVYNVRNIIIVTPIEFIYSEPTRRHVKEVNCSEMVTFNFDTAKYSTPYKISIGIGEFVSFAFNSAKDPKVRMTFFGHILNYDEDKNRINILRYHSNNFIVETKQMYIDLDQLVGIFRYSASIEEHDEIPEKRMKMGAVKITNLPTISTSPQNVEAVSDIDVVLETTQPEEEVVEDFVCADCTFPTE